MPHPIAEQKLSLKRFVSYAILTTFLSSQLIFPSVVTSDQTPTVSPAGFDLNANGSVALDDLSVLIPFLGSTQPTHLQLYDFDHSGKVDFGDFDAMRTAIVVSDREFDIAKGDGKITSDDLNLLSAHIGSMAGGADYNVHLDFYPDGIIDESDYLMLLDRLELDQFTNDSLTPSSRAPVLRNQLMNLELKQATDGSPSELERKHIFHYVWHWDGNYFTGLSTPFELDSAVAQNDLPFATFGYRHHAFAIRSREERAWNLDVLENVATGDDWFASLLDVNGQPLDPTFPKNRLVSADGSNMLAMGSTLLEPAERKSIGEWAGTELSSEWVGRQIGTGDLSYNAVELAPIAVLGPGVDWRGSTYEDSQTYQDGLKNFLLPLKRYIRDRGRKLYLEAEFPFEESGHEAEWTSFLGLTDGVLDKAAFGSKLTSQFEKSSLTGWQNRLAYYKEVLAQKKKLFISAVTSDWSETAEKVYQDFLFTFTSYLLIKEPALTFYSIDFGSADSFSAPSWARDLELDLGRAQGEAVAVPDETRPLFWYRPYQYGMAFVNPTASDQTVNLSALGYAAQFYDKLGKPISEFLLKAGSGEMIFTYAVKAPPVDINADGIVNHVDLQLFNDVWKANAQDVEFSDSLNLNGDLVIDEKDLVILKESYVPVFDFDGSGQVDSTDAGLLQNEIGKNIGTAEYQAIFDVNADGKIDEADGAIFESSTNISLSPTQPSAPMMFQASAVASAAPDTGGAAAMTSFSGTNGNGVINEGTDIEPGLQGHWKLDEGAGTTADDSSITNNGGTVIGDPAYTPGASVQFTNPYALSFDGAGDTVRIPNVPSLNPTDSITMAAWIKSSQAATGTFSVLRHDGNFTALQVFSGTAHSTRFSGGGFQFATWDWPTSFGDGQWHHFASVYDKTSGFKIYKDGELLFQNSTVTGALDASIKEMCLGAKCESGLDAENYIGALDDVRVYNRALSPNEIAALSQGYDFVVDTDGDGCSDHAEQIIGEDPLVASECAGLMSPLVRVFKPSASTPSGNMPSNMPTISTFANSYIQPTVKMLKNEAESLQLAVKNPGAVTASLDYTITFNSQPTTDITVTLYNVDFGNSVRWESTVAGDRSPPGSYTDPLLPYQPGTNITISNPAFWWITVKSSKTAQPGNYQLNLTLRVGAETITRSANIDVLNYELPKAANFKLIFETEFANEAPGLTPFDYHGATTIPQKEQVVSNYMDYFNMNRINHATPYYDPACTSCSYLAADALHLPVTSWTPGSPGSMTIDFTSFDQKMKKYFDDGNMGAFIIDLDSWGHVSFRMPQVSGTKAYCQPGTEQGWTPCQPADTDFTNYSNIQTLYWTLVTNHLAEKGWLDESMMYIDEPFDPGRNGITIPFDNVFSNIVRSVSPSGPKLAVFLDNHAPEFIDMIDDLKNIDYWAPIEYVPEYLQALAGLVNPFRVVEPTIRGIINASPAPDKMGAYWTSSGHMWMDRPSIDNRIWGLKNWKNDVHILLHWNVLQFVYRDSNGVITNSNSWNNVNSRWGAGGVTLFYPPCRTGQCTSFNPTITPSIRSEMFRDALDDFDSLKILNDLIQTAQGLGLNITQEQNAINQATNLVTDFSNWTRNIDSFEQARRNILDSIIQLSTPAYVGTIAPQTVPQGGSFATFDLDDYFSDADTPDNQLTMTASGNTSLIVNISPTTHIVTLTTPNATWMGSESITFTAIDPGQASASSPPIAFTVNGISIPGLVAYWKLDDGSGVTAVDSGPSALYGGTITNLAGPLTTQWTIPPVVAPTKFSNPSALRFDGTNEFISVPHNAAIAFTQAQSFTLSAWVNVPSLPNAWKGVLAKSKDAGFWYGIWISNTNRWVFGGTTPTNGTAISNITCNSVTTGWHHVAILQQGGSPGTRKMYIDGVEGCSGNGSRADGTGPLLIGAAGTDAVVAGEFFNGTVDEVRIYNRALSADEVAALAAGSHRAVTWKTTPVTTSWNDATNWDIGDVPGPYDSVFIPTNLTEVKSPVLASQVTVNGTLQLRSGSFLNLNGFNFTVNGLFSNDGTVKLKGSESVTLTQDNNSGTWEYGGNDTGTEITVKDFGAGADYFNLTINDSSATTVDKFGLSSALSVAQNLLLTKGMFRANGKGVTVSLDLTMADGTLVCGGTNPVIVAQHFTRTGTGIIDCLDPTDTIRMTGSSGNLNLGNSPDVKIYNLEVGPTGGTTTVTSGTTGGPNLRNVKVGTGTLRLNGTLIPGQSGGELTSIGTISNGGGALQIGADYTINVPTFAAKLVLGSADLNITKTVSFSQNCTFSGSVTHEIGITGETGDNNWIVNTNGKNLTFTNGNFKINPKASRTVTFNTGTGNISLTGGSGTLTIQGVGTTDFSAANLTTLHFTQTSGIFNAPSSGKTFQMNGTWDRSTGGTFNHSSGTVTLGTSGNQTIRGSTNFFNLTKQVTAAATLSFQQSVTQTISGLLTLQGPVAPNYLQLRSMSTGTRWNINVPATPVASIARVDVQDSNNTGAVISASDSIGLTQNNVGWSFGNNAPTVTSRVEPTINEDTPSVVIDLSIGSADPDGNPLRYKITALPADAADLNGTLYVGNTTTTPVVLDSLMPAGEFRVTYKPALNNTASVTFKYRANDGTVDSVSEATRTINFTPVNDLPIPSPQAADVTEDTAKSIVLSGTDVDGTVTHFKIITGQGPTHGTLNITPDIETPIGSPVVYTPQADYNGGDRFAFSVKDNTGAWSAAPNATADVTITVNAQNELPLATSASINTNQDTPVSFTLSGTDVDGTVTHFKVSSLPVNGSLKNGNSNVVVNTEIPISTSITYTPNQFYHGSDIFTFRVKDDSNEWSIAPANVNITVNQVVACANNTPPIAEAGNNIVGAVGSPVTLDASASTDPGGQIVAYWWLYGDGEGTGWQPNAVKEWTYRSSGTYTAKLWVRDDCGSVSQSDEITVTVGSSNIPQANFTADKTSGRFPLAVNFTDTSVGTITGWLWNFDGGASTSTQRNPTFTYNNVGVYTVSLTVMGPAGSNTKVMNNYINVTSTDPCDINQLPTANAGGNKNGFVGQNISFNGGNSTDSDGSIQTYQWNFGDGQNATGQSASHAYSGEGTYTATLTVTDNCGGTATAQNTVTISPGTPCTNNTPPSANAGADKSGVINIPMSFDASASTDSNGQVVAYWWTFGDGTVTNWQPNVTMEHTYLTANTYTAKLWVKDNCGTMSVADSLLVNVTAIPTTPIANFIADKTFGNTPLTVKFTDSSLGTVQSYLWNFGDNSTSIERNPTHIFTTLRLYDISLKVTGPTGLTDTKIKPGYIEVSSADPCANNRTPTANAGGNKTGFVGQNISFNGGNSTDSDGSIQTYQWNFGDSQTGTGQSASHAYSNEGTYAAILTVTDNCGGTATAQITVTVTAGNSCSVNTPPLANAGPDKSAVINVPVTFDASLSTDPGGQVVSYWWTFGDGAVTNWQPNVTMEHTYLTANTYTAKLWVKDNCGTMSVADSLLVNVFSSAVIPQSNFNADKTSGRLPLTVNFTDTSVGTITSWLWNFGDNSTSTQRNPTYTYNNVGVYTVSLTATGPAGSDTKTRSNYINVTNVDPCSINQLPTANAGGNKTGFVGQDISFNGGNSTDSDGSIQTYQWNFGDSQSASGQSVNHAYSSAGTYTATLTVTDNCGGTATAQITVTVSANVSCTNNTAPTANGGADKIGTVNVALTFDAGGSSDSNGQVVQYWWTFGDGAVTNWQPSAVVQHTYAAVGTYTAQLWVRDNCNTMSTVDTVQVEIRSGSG